MPEPEFVEDDILTQIDWDHLSDALPQCDNIFELDPPLLHNFSNSSPADSISSWIGAIETTLMKDDDARVDQQPNQELCTDFLADILVDAPAHGTPACSPDDGSGEVLDINADKDSSASDDGSSAPSEGEKDKDKEGGADASPEINNDVDRDPDDGEAEVNNGGEDPDDPISKKRRRQLRNRDAAMRSRERKKMYVKDLEMKSRYLEGECRRLDRLLQCFIAENQVLRLGLQKGSAFGVTSTKQESAVLLLESLLLGSLLWFLGMMCLFILPAMPQSALVALPPENGAGKAPENVAQRGARSKMFTSLMGQSLVNGRRCKASRTRMKLVSVFLNVSV